MRRHLDAAKSGPRAVPCQRRGRGNRVCARFPHIIAENAYFVLEAKNRRKALAFCLGERGFTSPPIGKALATGTGQESVSAFII